MVLHFPSRLCFGGLPKLSGLQSQTFRQFHLYDLTKETGRGATPPFYLTSDSWTKFPLILITVWVILELHSSSCRGVSTMFSLSPQSWNLPTTLTVVLLPFGCARSCRSFPKFYPAHSKNFSKRYLIRASPGKTLLQALLC